MQKEAKDNKIAITAGIHEPGEKGSGKIKNTAIWIDEEGELVQRYQKLHLFDMELTNGPHAHEGEYVFLSLPVKLFLTTNCSIIEEGMEILPPFKTPVGLVGLLICFDVSRQVDKWETSLLNKVIASIPRSSSGLEAARSSDHHIPLSFHCSNR